MLFTEHPLTPEELYFALFDTDPKILCHWDPEETTLSVIKRFIVSASNGFVELTSSEYPRVQFIHGSVKDFLIQRNGLQEIWAEYNLATLIRTHPSRQSCFDIVEDSFYGLPIVAALARGSYEAAKALLEAKTEAQPGNLDFEA